MIDVAKWLSERGISLSSLRPGQHKTKCPRCGPSRIHNKGDKSLSVSIGEDGWTRLRCHHCNWDEAMVGADAATESFRYPKKRKPAPVVPTDKLPDPNDRFYNWLKENRGISKETAEHFKLTATKRWMPQTQKEEWVIAFPYFRQGTRINTKYRTFKEKHHTMDKGAELIWFNLDGMDETETIVSEGEYDAVAIAEAGYKNVISVPNGANGGVNDKEPEDYLSACLAFTDPVRRFVLAGDGDEPGRKLMENLARRLGKRRCRVAIWPEGCKDANETLLKHGKDAVRKVISGAEDYPISGILTAEQVRPAMEAFCYGNSRQGIPTGWNVMNQVFNIMPGSLTVVTGIPGHGKSAWLEALSVNLSLGGWHWALFSFESPEDIQMAFIISKYIGKPAIQSDNGHMTEFEMDCGCNWAYHHYIFIRPETESPTPEWVIEKATDCVVRYGTRGIIVDPWNEMEHGRKPGMTETEYVSEVLHKFRQFAQERNVAVFLVAHPSKPMRSADGLLIPPGPYDISGSANWYNKPDIVLTVFREDPKSNEVEIICGKSRYAWIATKGRTAKLNFDPMTTRYYEPEPY
jgi:twinkle protein